MDRPPAIEELLRHRTWLRRLASSLVLDAARADDVVQETLLAALRRPPPDAGRPQAWLASVARRIARGFTRREEGRERHERAAARPEAQPATDEVVAHAALAQRVAAIVLALDEPYRTALLLRFFEELPPRAIARRTDVPVETARTRVKRGVELVRARVIKPEELVELLRPRERKSLAVALAAPATTGAALLEASVAGGVVMSGGVKLAVAAVIVAAATVTWWVSGRIAAPAREMEPGLAAAMVGEAASDAQDETSPIAGERVASAEAAEPPIGSDAWLARAGLAVTVTPADGLPVEVVDAVSGQPAAGVAVMQLITSDLGEGLGPGRAIELLGTPRDLRRFVVEVHRTDVEGRTRVAYWPTMPQCTLVAAQEQRRAVGVVGQPPFLPLVLRLRAAATLEVEVVDRDGAPWRGMPVAIAQELGALGLFAVTSTEMSDDDGRVSLPDVDLLASHVTRRDWIVAAGRNLATTTEARATIDPDRLPDGPITLTVGESGAIELELVDERGARLLFGGPLEGELRREGGAFGESVTLRFTDGVATLDPVGLGLEWRVTPTVADRYLTASRGMGPRSDGETVRAKLTCEPEGPIFIARLVDEAGAAIAGRDVDFMVRTVRNASGGSYNGHADRVRTDSGGGLRLALPTIGLASHRRSLLLTLPATADAAPRRAYLQLPALLARTTVELGDIVARSEEATLAGRVVRDDGAPLAGIEVEIEWLDRSPSGTELEEFGFPRTESDAEGRFEVIGWPPGRYRILVGGVGYAPPRELAADETLRLPARDLVFTLAPTRVDGSIVLGSVVAPQLPSRLLRQLVVRFRRAEGERAGTVASEAAIDDRGAFQWIAKESGLFDAEVVASGSSDALEIVVRIAGVAVGDGATTVDPRLQRIDLGSRLRSIGITIVDEAHRPVIDAMVVTRVAGSVAAVPRLAWSGQTAPELLTHQPALDVEVFASGGRSASRRGVSGPVELTLAPASVVATTIRLEPAALAADPRFAFTAYALPDGGKVDGVAEWLTATIGPDGAATLALPPLPRWRIGLLVRGREGMARFHREELTQSEALLELDPAGGAAAVTLRVDPAAIDAFVKRMSEG